MNKQLINTKRAKCYAGSFFAFSYRQACQLFVSPPAHGKRALTHMNFAAATIRNTILPKSSDLFAIAGKLKNHARLF